MSDINSVTSNSALDQYAIGDKATKKNSQLDKNAFMDLMIAQLNNQSPLDPQDNGQFISQLAQFSSLEGIQQLNDTVNSVASQFRSAQALQASAMVGRSVYVSADSSSLDADGGISGLIDVPAYTNNLKVSVLNASGELVDTITLGPQSAGEVKFDWDGKNSKGEAVAPGTYYVKAEANYGGGSEQVESFLKANVDSVSVGTNGNLILNLAGRGSVTLNQVRQIS